ncbi:hypothetical protein FB451DRAFT_38810 [Mycena latifolia]|nr:hypothetical protein FB451DRAFT_38810 [Mycena latifolia]
MNINAKQLIVHRFLGLAVCHSTTIDPRHLEHNNYTYWTGDIGALIGDKLKCSLLAPQFPIYVSPKGGPPNSPPSPESDIFPNLSLDSGRTEADSEAQGVYVDIAIVIPIIQPRHIEQLGTFGTQLDGKSLKYFITTFLHQFPHLSPRCIRVSGFEAPLLGELKPGPTRHPNTIGIFHTNLTQLLGQGMAQAEEQALCLFCSWRFASQNEVLLLAGAGDYYKICRLNRQWAVDALARARRPYSSDLLKRLKAAGTERFDASMSDPLAEDGDWTEDGDLENLMYGSPLDALARQKQVDERAERRIRRDKVREKYQTALNTSPNDQDRASPLFTNEALNTVHRSETGVDLFESNTPEIFFAKPSGTWSAVLQLGSDQSNRFMKEIQEVIRKCEIQEETRREHVYFEESPVHT